MSKDKSYRQLLADAGEGLCLLRETELVYVGEPVRTERIGSSRDVSALIRSVIPWGPREVLVALFLDAKSKPLGWYRFTGGGSAVAIKPSDIFRPALRANAESLILAHNHPSGDSTPSAEDVALTERAVRAGDMIGIRVLDHVIIGETGYFSFLDAGLMTPPHD